jgi:uncharacterized RDD family membrane protein YckC
MQSLENERVFYGGFFVRLAAACVDNICVLFGLLFLRIPVWVMADSGHPIYQPIFFSFTPWDIFLYLLGCCYYIFLTYLYGATLGKRLFSLRVVAADGEKLTLWSVIYRETIGKYLSAVFLYLGYIMAGIDREKRAFHDMLADTRVVYALGQRSVAAYPQPMAPYQYPQRPQGGEAQSEQPQNKELQNGAPFQTMGPENA